MSSFRSSSENDGSHWSSKRRKDDEEETQDKEETSTSKKPRVVWTMELHQQFVAAVNLLGIDKAFPMKILEVMNVPGLQRENVASHLQKYRMYLKRLCGIPKNQGGPSSQTPAEAAFGSMSSPTGLELLALASSGQLPAESLANLHAAAFTPPAVSKPEKPKRFSFKPKNSRLGNGQGTSNINKQVNLSLSIPTNMEANGLGNFLASQPFWEMDGSSQFNQNISPLMEMTPYEPMGQLMNQNFVSPQLPIVQSPNTIPGVWTPMVDLSMMQSMQFPGPSFPLTNGSGNTTLPKPVDELSSWRMSGPGYDRVDEIYFKKSPEWLTQNIGSTYQTPEPVTFQGACSQPDFISPTMTGGGQNNTNLSMVPIDPLLASTSRRPENPTDPGYQSNLFSESFGHDDMLSMFEQQDGIIPVVDNFGYNGYF